MIPTDEKVRAMANRALRALEKDPAVFVRDSEGARRILHEAVAAGVGELETMRGRAEEKVRSLGRGVASGTREWDELGAKYLGEEIRKRGYGG